MKNLLKLAFCLLSIFSLQAQDNFPVNGVSSKYEAVHAFVNAQIQVDPDTQINQGILLIKGDEIIAIGEGISIPKNAIIHNVEGAYIYPSFIDVYTNYGLGDVEKSEWKPRPQLESKTSGAYSWNQALKPEYQAAQHFSPNKKVAAQMRSNGFGTVLSFQKDGIARGTSCIVSLSDNRAQKVLIKENTSAHYSFKKGSSRQSYPSSFMGSVALLRQSIYDALWANHNKDESNLSLNALHQNLKLKAIIEVDNRHAALTAEELSKEFKMNFIIKGSGDEYQNVKELKKTGSTFILPLNFPKAYDVSNAFLTLDLTLQRMKHWEQAPANPAILAAEEIKFAFTTADLKDSKDFIPNLRKTLDYGLSKADALHALTTVPAKIIGLENSLGILKKGMKANFVIWDHDLFEEDSKLLENWVQGEGYTVNQREAYDYRGIYILKIDGERLNLHIKGEADNPKAEIIEEDSTTVKVHFSIENQLLSLRYEREEATIRLSGHGQSPIEGQAQMTNGDWVPFILKKKEPFTEDEEKGAENKLIDLDKVLTINDVGEQWFPNRAYGWTEKPEQKALLFTNATIWTNEEIGVLENASIAVLNGKIIAVGNASVETIKAKYPFTIIDAKGKHITTGIIDEHSHIALRSVNEGGQASSAEVRMKDALNPDDVNIYRQLAGGVTSAQLLHGSANPIGGQSALIKLRWGANASEMLFEGAKPFIKFALGENVKQSNWGSYSTIRFPQTRMGVEQVYYDAFIRADEYDKDWKAWDRLSASQKKNTKMPRKDLELDCLLEILKDQREITCHSYRQSEINMLMHVADSMDFTLNTFTHILEGYKVAEKMKAHGVGASTFSDWWAYKYEVNDAIPHNGALLHKMGVVTAFNSDDPEMARRLNQEAAKAVKYGNVSEEDAWKFVTLNPAKLLHIDHKVGSLKKGMDADIVVWSGHPMSIYTIAEQTYVDGRCYYSLENDRELRDRNQEERARLIQKMLQKKNKGKSTQKIPKEKHHHHHCDSIDE